MVVDPRSVRSGIRKRDVRINLLQEEVKRLMPYYVVDALAILILQTFGVLVRSCT